MSDQITITRKELRDAVEAGIRAAQQPAPSKLEDAKRRLTEFTREVAEFGADNGNLSIAEVLALEGQLDRDGSTVEDWERQ